MLEVTAGTDDEKLKKICANEADIFYFMIYSSNPEERRKWAGIYKDVITAKVRDEYAGIHQTRLKPSHTQ